MEFTFAQIFPVVCLPCRQTTFVFRIIADLRVLLYRLTSQKSLKSKNTRSKSYRPEVTFSFDYCNFSPQLLLSWNKNKRLSDPTISLWKFYNISHISDFSFLLNSARNRKSCWFCSESTMIGKLLLFIFSFVQLFYFFEKFFLYFRI